MVVERNQHPAAARDVYEFPDAQQQARLAALSRLGRGVAHDLNNILHVINSVADLLERRLPRDDPAIGELLGMLQRNIGRGKELTIGLLAFCGRETLRPVALSPNRLIADLTERLRQTVGRGVAVETHLAGSLWQVHADQAALERAILNLALNGRDAMPQGGKLTIETANVALGSAELAGAALEPGDYVAITIRDEGGGMSKDVMASAFEPYFTTKDSGHMVGLGLSQVYGFVRQSCGHVRIESAPAAGTAVTLFLRRLDEPQAALSNIVALGPKSAKARATPGLRGLRVLVVEDESLIGMLAEELLEQLGCRMTELVSSLPKALEMANRADIDFALLDVDVGGEPVYPLAQLLRARGVPFVFMSGYGGLEGAWAGHPIIQKPFDLAQLKLEIERALAGG
jgi:nitrogen-specific signal transduction histidine kinase/CheY-like chemotaxis protein